jgi:hypothetical protein
MAPNDFDRWIKKKVRPIDPIESKRWQKDGYNVDGDGNPIFADGSTPASNHADSGQEQ